MSEDKTSPKPHLAQRRRSRSSTAQFGTVAVERVGMPRAPFGEAFHFLMRSSWPIFCVVFSVYYLLINAIFGAIYYWDLAGIENARPHSYMDAFMFSVQTIATIGYGHLAPKSGFVNAVVVFESMASFLGLSLWTGLAFSRFSRPTARVMFSDTAVIAPDDGVPTLMFRVANGRGNRIVDASITVTLLANDINAEGVAWRRQVDLKLVRARSAVFALSWTVFHRIDATSPLRGVTDIVHSQMAPQLVVSLLGIDDTFGQPIHAMKYYEAADILPGKRFVDIASVAGDGHRVLNFTLFHDVEDDPRAGEYAQKDGTQ
jgi:inward rectifier potassium channel